MGEDTDPTSARNLGLLIDEALKVPGINSQPERQSRVATVRRVQRLVDTMTGARDNALIHEFQSEVCRLPAQGCGTTEFDMPEDKLAALVNAGRTAMQEHLAGQTDL